MRPVLQENRALIADSGGKGSRNAKNAVLLYHTLKTPCLQAFQGKLLTSKVATAMRRLEWAGLIPRGRPAFSLDFKEYRHENLFRQDRGRGQEMGPHRR
jgi:hypothetical protein